MGNTIGVKFAHRSPIQEGGEKKAFHVYLHGYLGLALSGPAFAQSLTIQGRVATSSNTPVTGTAVQFRVQIRSPDAANCVLFDETHTLNLSTTNGLFSVSLNDGSGTVNAPSTYGLEAAISNRAAFSINSSYCSSGTGVVTYTPNADDNRKVILQFYDPSSMSGFEQIPEMDLNPMAFAMESRTVGGYPATSMMRVDSAGIPAAAPAYTVGEAAELKLLADGTSTKYTPASSTNGAQIPAFATDPSSPPAGSIWYNSTSGELHYRAGGTTQVVGAGGGGGGTITSITVGNGLTGGGSSGAVSVSLPSGTGGQVFRFNGSNWSGYNLGLGDLFSSTLGSAVVSAACTAGQTMYYDSTAKELKCQSIGLASSDLSGVLGVSHGGTGLSAGTVGALPYFSSTSALSALAAGSSGQVLTITGGVPSWQNLPASSFSGSGSTNQLAKFTGASAVGNSILTDDGTNVGIGTTAPVARLEVAGSLRLADGGESCSAGANVGMMKYSGGSLFFCNASGWQTLGVSGAGLTSLNGLTANTQTFAIGSAGTTPAWSSAGSVHTLNLPTASSSNTGILSSSDWSTFNGKLGASAVFAGDVTGTYNANVVTKLQGVALSTTAPAAGQALKLVGSTWTPSNLGFGDLKTTGGAATMASAVCNAGQTMYFDSTTGDLKCQAIAVDNGSVTGTLAVAHGGTGASTTSQNFVFAGPTSGSGAPSFRALTAADISGLSTYWTSATGGINYAGGNVGIGTSAPGKPLSVVAASGMQGIFQSTGANNAGVLIDNAAGGLISMVQLQDAGTTKWQIGKQTDNTFFIYDSANARNLVASSGTNLLLQPAGGNVGVGLASPGAKLDVAGAINAAGSLISSRLDTSAEGGRIYSYRASDNAQGFYLQTYGSSTTPRFRIVDTANTSERLVIDAGGNVGINTTVPTAKLEVSGSIRLADGGESCSGGTNVGMMKYSGGSLFFCNASGWQTLGVSGAGLTSLNGLTANTQTFAIGSAGTSPAWSSSGSVHTLNLPTASASNSGLLSSSDWSTFNGKLGTSTNFAGDVTGTYNANVVTKIQGVAVGTTAPAAGQFLKFGTSWSPANLTFGDIKLTAGGATLASAACTAGQTMYYDSSTGDLKCQSIGLGNASISGVLPIANGGTGAASTSQNYVFAGPTSGSGAPSFRALTTADISGLNTYWTSATGGINYASGNVGIGTSAPGAKFELNAGNGASHGLIVSNNDAISYRDSGGNARRLVLTSASNGNYFGPVDGGWGATSVFSAGTDMTFRVNGATAFNMAMYIGGNGNVGIATTVPSQALHVVGNFSAPASSGNTQTGALRIGNSSGSGVLDLGQWGSSGSWIQSANSTNLATNYPLLLNPNGGNVGIGTTSATSPFTVAGMVQSSTGGFKFPDGTVQTTAAAGSSPTPAFSVNKNNVNQTVATNTWTLLTWNNVVFDTNSNFASNRYTPTVAGKYQFNALVYCNDNTNYCGLLILKNSASCPTGYVSEAFGYGNNIVINTTAIIDMNGSTDYVTACAYNGGGTTIMGQLGATGFSGALLSAGGGSGASQWTTQGGGITYSSGNVGIGTSAPVGMLHIKNASLGGTGPATSGTTDNGIAHRVEANTAVLDQGFLSIGTSWLQARVRTDFTNNQALALNPNGGNVGIGTSVPAQALDVGTGNVKMGYATFNWTSPSTAAQNWVGGVSTPNFYTLCSGNGFALSANCYANVSPYGACPVQVNASGQVAMFNCSGSTAQMVCNGVCANMR